MQQPDDRHDEAEFKRIARQLAAAEGKEGTLLAMRASAKADFEGASAQQVCSFLMRRIRVQLSAAT